MRGTATCLEIHHIGSSIRTLYHQVRSRSPYSRLFFDDPFGLFKELFCPMGRRFLKLINVANRRQLYSCHLIAAPLQKAMAVPIPISPPTRLGSAPPNSSHLWLRANVKAPMATQMADATPTIVKLTISLRRNSTAKPV